MNADIIEMRDPVARRPPRTKSPKSPAPAAAAREARRAAVKAKINATQMWSAGALGGVAAVIMGLSLTHLSHGIEVISHPASGWESWAMAVGIDLGMVCSEIAALTATEKVRLETRWYSWSMIGGTLILSAAMNAFGFASQADTLPFQAAGVVFGVAVPAAIYVLMRQAAAHYLDAFKRS